MDSEVLSARPRIDRTYCRRRFPLQRESNPLFRAVVANDLNELKALVEAGNSVNVQNARGSSLLNFVMRRQRVEIFDYLLGLEQIDVNFLDRLEQSPLIYLAGVCFHEYFALELIKKGADIHLTDDAGFSFLHLAAKSESDDTLAVGRLIIEMGADIDKQGYYGVTPLYAACDAGNYDWICMLLYYGADVTIPSDRGILPLVVVSETIPEKQQLFLQQLLFDYTFDGGEIVRLPTLVVAMTLNSDLFERILSTVSEVHYDVWDLQHFVSSLTQIKPRHLRLFVERFGYIVKDMINNFSPMEVLMRFSLEYGFAGVTELLDIFLESRYIAEFAQASNQSLSLISMFLEVIFKHKEVVLLEEVTKIICLMLSFGLRVTSVDLDDVFDRFGFCELFQILLHMDVAIVDNESRSMAVLFYNPKSSVEDFCHPPTDCAFLVEYFNHPKVKYCVLAHSDDEVLLEKVRKMPQVPLLVELSRNAVRRFISEGLGVKSCARFYTILKWLPIGEMNRKIVALEKKLY